MGADKIPARLKTVFIFLWTCSVPQLYEHLYANASGLLLGWERWRREYNIRRRRRRKAAISGNERPWPCRVSRPFTLRVYSPKPFGGSLPKYRYMAPITMLNGQFADLLASCRSYRITTEFYLYFILQIEDLPFMHFWVVEWFGQMLTLNCLHYLI